MGFNTTSGLSTFTLRSSHSRYTLLGSRVAFHALGHGTQDALTILRRLSLTYVELLSFWAEDASRVANVYCLNERVQRWSVELLSALKTLILFGNIK